VTPSKIEVQSVRQSERTDVIPSQSRFGAMMRGFGIVLCLGGVGHTVGVVRYYVSNGVPEMNRVLLDVWITEAQLMAGVLYFLSALALRAGKPWRTTAVFGATTVLSYAVPFIPVLFVRAPIIFWIAPSMYVVLSTFILARIAAGVRAESRNA